MDRPVLHMDSRQQMEQLDFRKRRVTVVSAVCRLPERVRMDYRRAMLDMDVHKQRNAAVVHYKKCRQQPFHIFRDRLFHIPFLSNRGYKDNTNSRNLQIHKIQATKCKRLMPYS